MSGGLIPAHAGSTINAKLCSLTHWAHPRSRGEHKSDEWINESIGGSSPLTRGAPLILFFAGGAHGLIPAHAGSTREQSCRWCPFGAHPRSRGEHHRRTQRGRIPRGSSPLTRGARAAAPGCFAPPGLIPAHAGSTVGVFFVFCGVGAHPRSRGEHFLLLFWFRVPVGSSPLTRGALCFEFQALGFCGLIPAHAGSTPRAAMCSSAARAHPRSRGEHLTCTLVSDEVQGSSPLTRGALCASKLHARLVGLIPAHAGSTRGWSLFAADWEGSSPLTRGARPTPIRGCGRGWAHPRSRGEHLFTIRGDTAPKSSSPLTRGALIAYSCRMLAMGLIPAHAGSTIPAASPT